MSTTLPQILSAVAAYYHVHPSAIMGQTRKYSFVIPRHVAMVVARRAMMLSTTAIGEFFGRDHSSVVHALKVTERNPDRMAEVVDILASLDSYAGAVPDMTPVPVPVRPIRQKKPRPARPVSVSDPYRCGVAAYFRGSANPYKPGDESELWDMGFADAKSGEVTPDDIQDARSKNVLVSFRQIAKEVSAAGGDAWDAIEDPDAYVKEMRG